MRTALVAAWLMLSGIEPRCCLVACGALGCAVLLWAMLMNRREERA